MKFSTSAEKYRQDIYDFAARSYTKTLFSGYLFRFLVELITGDESHLIKQYPDADLYTLAHLVTFDAFMESSNHTHRFTYSQLPDLVAFPTPTKQQGHVLYLCGHLPGSWICEVGAKYRIAPEFFRQHIHLWRSLSGPVLHATSRPPSSTYNRGLVLRVNTIGYNAKSNVSLNPFSSLVLEARREILPYDAEWMPTTLKTAPSSPYVRGHAYISNMHFIVEQNLSITIESNGQGWTAIVWTDIGSRDLSTSVEYHRFINHMTANSKTGHRDIRLIPVNILGRESTLNHQWPLPLDNNIRDAQHEKDGALVQTASHLPSEHHLMIDDHSIAAQDPLYALAPILLYAAFSENHVLATLQRWYDIITSTKWNKKHSSDHLGQLVLQKHILDDHVNRHEEVLRFIRSPVLAQWPTGLTSEQKMKAAESKSIVETDYEFLLLRFRQLSVHYQEAISVLVSATALAESKKQITLATQVTKLTVLATIFLPLSYCTSIFGMNFIELNNLRIWIWAVVTVCVGLVTLIVYFWENTMYWFASRQCFVGFLEEKYLKLRIWIDRKPKEASPV